MPAKPPLKSSDQPPTASPAVSVTAPHVRSDGAANPALPGEAWRRFALALAGRYTIERELGRGGMATVYLARDERLHRQVAIKVLEPVVASELGTERFLREIEIAARLQHPHIVSLHDCGEAAGLLYYVMPFVDGMSLRERLAREPQLPLDVALAIARDVAAALDYAHAHGVVHRDIKPANILLESGDAVIADFGVARAIEAAGSEQLTRSGIAVGTTTYMSPEQAAGEMTIDGRSDVYSLGCVVYEMLAGEPPFTGPNVAARRQFETPRPLRITRRTVPQATDKAIQRALATAPADRFATAGEFARALSDPGPLPRTAPGLRRRWTAIAATAMITAAIGWLVIERLPPQAPTPGIAVVVIPFGGGSTSPAGRRHGSTAQTLFTQSIEWLPGVRALDGSELVAAGRSWRSIRLPHLLDGARGLGAKYVIVGDVLGGDRGMRIATTLYDAHSGDEIAKLEDGAEGDRLDAPVARLALGITRALAEREGFNVGGRAVLFSATSSATAFGHLIRAQERFWRRDVDGAAEELRAALLADSTCGLAYHRLSVAETWRYDYPAAFAVVDAGLAQSARMAPRWTALLRAQRYYVRREGDSATAAFQEVVLDRPGSIDGWFGLAESLYHFAALTGHRRTDARPALQRVEALDSAFAPIHAHLFDLALMRRDTAEARRALVRLHADNPDLAPRRAAFEIWLGSADSRRRAMQAMRRADRRSISVLVEIALRSVDDPAVADTLGSFLASQHNVPADRQRGGDYRLVALAAQRRWPDALRAWRASVNNPEFDGWLVLASLAGHPAAEDIGPMMQRARASLDEGRTPHFSLGVFHDMQQRFQALVHHAVIAGDSAVVLRLLRRAEVVSSKVDSSDRSRESLVASLHARLALLAGDTTRASAHLERAASRSAEPFEAFYPLAGSSPERMLLAELHAARGSRAAALRWLDSFDNSLSLGDLFYRQRIRELRARLTN
jgi:serine/threonine protein kinase